MSGDRVLLSGMVLALASQLLLIALVWWVS